MAFAKIIVTWYLQDCVKDETHPMGIRAIDKYDMTGRVVNANGGGWKSRAEWKKHAKKMPGFVEFDEKGRAKHSFGTYYGLHSYQLVELVDDGEKELEQEPVISGGDNG